ncbi:LOW QUALITY PROTEIN: hypothetical protein SAMD00019534_024070, partial [Acytostelium subglobosum LB1]|uniref:hypothetical protein n=1 Tax=Acytostelium subglobosum LB1 TaxID=1410327 RepID=UPI000644A76A
LLQWSQQHGIVWNDGYMEIHDFEHGGRGVRARCNIPAGTMLVSVPEPMLMHINSTLSIDTTKRMTNVQRLVFQLIVERLLGDRSRWYRYLVSIPERYDTSSMYTDNEIDNLQYSYYMDEAKRHKKEMMVSYDQFKCKQLDDHYNINEIREGLADFGLFKWAWGVIQTRTYYFNNISGSQTAAANKKTVALSDEASAHDNACLVPMADLFNHSSTVSTRASYNSAQRCYQVFTETSFNQGDQVLISYGNHSNSTLLHFYGFIIDDNPQDSIIIPSDQALPLPSSTSNIKPLTTKEQRELDRLTERKEQLLSMNGLSMQGYDWLLPFTWNYLAVLRVYFMSKSEMDEEKHLNLFYNDEPISEKNDHLVGSFLLELCNNHLAKLRTSSNNDGDDNNAQDVRPQIQQQNSLLLDNARRLWTNARSFTNDHLIKLSTRPTSKMTKSKKSQAAKA